MATCSFDIIVIGGGHAGAEAAWAAANLGMRTAMITMDPMRIGTMSCNPAIGGLAKGQMVREIDALGGLMGLAADAAGIQFRVLNQSKGPAVRGPRAQCDKYAYTAEVQRLLRTRERLVILSGTVDELLVERGRVTGVVASLGANQSTSFPVDPRVSNCCGDLGPIDLAEKTVRLDCRAVVLTTGTFMRGLMHTGERQTRGGRVGESSAEGISGALRGLGFELGRLKTGTPPRLDRDTLDLASLEPQPGDNPPEPFSELTLNLGDCSQPMNAAYQKVAAGFPTLRQVDCWLTETNGVIHDAIHANLDRAPMYNGQIETAGPRYCPSIEDKVVRFADRSSHHVFLEPESLTTNEIYCNGISTSLPADVQDVIVHGLARPWRSKD